MLLNRNRMTAKGDLYFMSPLFAFHPYVTIAEQYNAAKEINGESRTRISGNHGSGIWISKTDRK
jgi:hypothetical protein